MKSGYYTVRYKNKNICKCYVSVQPDGYYILKNGLYAHVDDTLTWKSEPAVVSINNKLITFLPSTQLSVVFLFLAITLQVISTITAGICIAYAREVVMAKEPMNKLKEQGILFWILWFVGLFILIATSSIFTILGLRGFTIMQQ
jgi:hypothetical protein